jgi:hypothetical protein
MKKTLLSILFTSLLLASPTYAVTLTNGEWSTTFNCSDWTYYPGGNPNTGCDGLTRDTDGNAGYYIRINSRDNNPTGGGGKGLGWQVDNGSGTSTSPTGSNLNISLPKLTNFWIRWYVSLPAGMPISSCTLAEWKILYVYGGSNSFYVDTNYGDDLRIVRSAIITAPYGFADAYRELNGTTTSQGEWIGIEMHFNLSGGVWEYWFYLNNQDNATPRYSGSYTYPISSVRHIGFPSNIKSSCIPNTPARFKFDDIAVSTKGRIGTRILVGGGGGAGDGDGGGGGGGCFIDTVRHGTQTSGGR